MTFRFQAWCSRARLTKDERRTPRWDAPSSRPGQRPQALHVTPYGVTAQATEHLSSVGSPAAAVRLSVMALPSSQASPTSTLPSPQIGVATAGFTMPAEVLLAVVQALLLTAGQVKRPFASAVQTPLVVPQTPFSLKSSQKASPVPGSVMKP